MLLNKFLKQTVQIHGCVTVYKYCSMIVNSVIPFCLVCFCSNKARQVPCEKNVASTYSCGNVCKKLLDCKNHYCEKICHSDPCESCSLTPEKVTTCCCGQTQLTNKRENCLEPVPTCDKICSKRLKCGQPSKCFTNNALFRAQTCSRTWRTNVSVCSHR